MVEPLRQTGYDGASQKDPKMSTNNDTDVQDKMAAWEAVPFVSNYYDVPLEGVSHLDGTPYVFF